MNITQRIKQLLDKSFGVKIERTFGKIIQKVDFNKKNKPFFIDFIGPSGVGKTTLFNTVYKNRMNPNHWLSAKEFLYHYNLHYNKVEKNERYADAISSKITQVLNNTILNHFDKLELFHFLQNVIKEEQIVLQENKNQKVVFEDGFFHAFGNVIYNLLNEDFKKYNVFLKHRAIVYCYNDAEIIVKRIVEREKVEGMRIDHRNKTYEEILEEQILILNKQKQLVEYLENKKTPCLWINTSNNLQENARLVNQFIRNVS